MSRRARHFLSILVLICLPMQALAAFDTALCTEQGSGDWGVAVAVDGAAAGDQHENLDFGGVSLDACGLCHLGCSPVSLAPVAVATAHSPDIFVPMLYASRIEHDSPPPLRPPRSRFV
jgi:hypothetical protein